jgi:diguanylate cyclase (GGDEF)-like protein
VPLTAERAADFRFLNEMGALMVWGTAVLFLDCIMIILIYERSRGWLGDRIFLRLALSGIVVLTFDQVMFFAGLHAVTGAGVSVLLGGWVAKMGAVMLYSVLGALYLRYCERPRTFRRNAPRIVDVFDLLTYRERYEDLLARTGRDALTGAHDRWRLETEGRALIDEAAVAGRPISLLLLDIDNFKSFNDNHGHAAGDAVLTRIAREMMTAVRANDSVYRFGGDEFIILADQSPGSLALNMAERIRRIIAAGDTENAARVTVSIGVATCAEDAADYDGLFAVADGRLYQAKAAGRNCAVGERVANDENPVRIIHAV